MKDRAMIALGILLLVIGPLFLAFPHQLARLGRPSSRSGREQYERGLRRRGLPPGMDEEAGTGRLRERIAGGVVTALGLALVLLG